MLGRVPVQAEPKCIHGRRTRWRHSSVSAPVASKVSRQTRPAQFPVCTRATVRPPDAHARASSACLPPTENLIVEQR
jgi:hypothetical protein